MVLVREWEVALAAAAAAAANAREAQRSGFAEEAKSDESPVTTADRRNEQIIVEMLTREFPDDGLLGEEGSHRESRSGRRWIIDPIDGTRDFVRGLPAWCVMIGLEAEGEIVTGVIHFPILDRVYSARRGDGAFLNGRPIRISNRQTIEESVLCVNGWKTVPSTPMKADWVDFIARFWGMRCFGGALDAMFVASGEAEVYLEPKVAPWDLAAMKVITEEAGAKFMSFAGRNTIYDGNCAVFAPPLEAQIRRFLRLK